VIKVVNKEKLQNYGKNMNIIKQTTTLNLNTRYKKIIGSSSNVFFLVSLTPATLVNPHSTNRFHFAITGVLTVF